jgi:hypothetical protein
VAQQFSGCVAVECGSMILESGWNLYIFVMYFSSILLFSHVLLYILGKLGMKLRVPEITGSGF